MTKLKDNLKNNIKIIIIKILTNLFLIYIKSYNKKD